MDVQVSLLAVVGCQSNTGGSLLAQTGVTGSAFNYTWNSNPPQDGPIATGLPEGDYTVTVTGVDACPASGKGRAEKDLSCIGVYFPSAFTPDNNGVNDRFGPLGSIFSLKEYSLSIYNRWGQRVFYSTNPLEKWDGRVMGFSTDTNMFTWLARYQLPGQSATIRKGTVVLIR